MEFVQGRELKACFEANERFRIADIVRIMPQILGALDYSHRQGVVHRDVKPANIFLLGRRLGEGRRLRHRAHRGVEPDPGRHRARHAAYMSPEQILGLPVDGRSDLFSAGVILYQFLTGERPFSGSSTTTMQKVLKEDPLPPSTLNVQVLPVMDAVVRKALAKHADERYQTAQEFADAIRAAAPAAGTAGRRMTMPRGAPAAAPTRRSSRPPRSPRRRTRRGGAAIRRRRRRPPPPPAAAQSRVPASRDRCRCGRHRHRGRRVARWQRFGADATTRRRRPRRSRPPLPAPPRPRRPPSAVACDGHGPGHASTISAVGLVDPNDPRYKGDKALQQDDARADAKSQIVAKALGLLVDAEVAREALRSA